jgi:hypothetical protein
MSMAGMFRRRDGIAGRRIAGESFLVPVCGTPVDMENIFVLNPLADFIWERLDGKHALETIVADILATYDVKQKQADTDVAELVGQLLAHGLVEEVAVA